MNVPSKGFSPPYILKKPADCSKTFGVKHYGAISGLVLAFAFGGQIIAPILGGFIFDSTQSYDIAFISDFTMSLFAGLLFYIGHKQSKSIAV